MPEYTVERRETSATCTKGDGTVENVVVATIYADGKFVTSVHLNWTTFCFPGGSAHGLAATDEQIIHATLGDEHIFTGEPSFPEHHDNVTEE